MSHAHVSPRPSLLGCALVQALIVCLLPLGTAFAQPGTPFAPSVSHVRVASEKTVITSGQHERGDMLMTATRGTVLQVIYTEGDRYVHRKSNWYWVLLPRDPWGTRPAGWISGHDVEDVPAAEMTNAASAADASLAEAQRALLAANEAAKIAAGAEAVKPGAGAAPATASEAAAGQLGLPEVVLNFAFDKSDLSDEAKTKLAEAVALLKTNAAVSFALEGHADWTGPEPYNEKLGLRRAESVKRHLVLQHHIPADRISVISYGESQPVASNATREGRAENRRVVVCIF